MDMLQWSNQEESSKAELDAPVTRLHQNVTHTLLASRSGSFLPKPYTVGDRFQRPGSLGDNRRRNKCHGPSGRACQRNPKSVAIASGVRDKTYLMLGLVASSQSRYPRTEASRGRDVFRCLEFSQLRGTSEY